MKGEKAMGMKGFKGFEKDFSCRGKQYEENTTYEEHGVGCYHKGVMHFYEDPWAVLDYYPLVNENGDISEFAEVEALGQVWDDCNKRATNKLHIGAKLGLKGFLKACIDFTLEKTKIENFRSVSSGYATQIGTSGDATQIGTSGDRTKINSTGKNTVIVCAGHGCIAKAKKGSWITLSEWEKNFVEKRYIPVCVKTEYVDGEKIKEDTYYTLENGEFVEV
jgi:hypothetical protein